MPQLMVCWVVDENYYINQGAHGQVLVTEPHSLRMDGPKRLFPLTYI